MNAETSSGEPPKKPAVLRNLFLMSRSLVVIAIIGLLIASVIVVAGAIAELYRIIVHLASGGLVDEGVGQYLAVNMTELIDLFLIAVALIIFALGLYQLFIDYDVKLPEWLNTPSLDALKTRLLLVVIVLLAVIFLGAVAESEGGVAIAGLGIAVAAVMVAIGYILSIYVRTHLALKNMAQKDTGQEK